VKWGDLVKVTIYVDFPIACAPLPITWPPPDEFIGIYIRPDREYRNKHLVMYDGGVWTTPGYQIEELDETG
jgi:hypothetical protein